MRYIVLACDYDGTLASEGKVADRLVEALSRFRASGRRLILVTGRELSDLLNIFPQVELFERVIAENGAVLYRPATREQEQLGESPPDKFVEALRKRGVYPLAVGRTIIATRHPQEGPVLEVIRSLGLEYQVIFNKGSVMVLPTGINKATGLKAGLNEIGLSSHNAVGIGDAENDHAFLSLCECSAAVANALPMLKERADILTAGSNGSGVGELIDRIISSDLREVEPRLRRHNVPLGKKEDGQPLFLTPYGVNVLVAGTSGSGKSTLATGILERLTGKGYQVCVIDPEGDYSGLGSAVVLGGSRAAPEITETLKILEYPDRNLVINLLAVPRDERPQFFEELLPRLQEIRARTGRPHWIVVDETHHLLPSSRDPAVLAIPKETYGLMLITVHPEHVAPAVLALINVAIAVGESPGQALGSFSRSAGHNAPEVESETLAPGEALYWNLTDPSPVRFRSVPTETERLRHRRKYAEGELAPEGSFYFRGPEGKLNLRAQNLAVFLQIAEGIDDETWTFHLERGEYSQWFRQFIKDGELAAEAEEIEKKTDLSAQETRKLIREAIEKRYTAPP